MQILVVEDDLLTAKQLVAVLKAEEYQPDLARGYKEAQELIDKYNYALILLDWNLGDGDGLEFLKEIRQEGYTQPVLMLSANNAIEGRVEVLDSGADDYLCKPYSNIELLARIRALLRREVKEKNTKITIKEITLDTIEHRVYKKEQPIELTKTEFELLQLLMQNSNVVLTRYQLSEHINKDNYALKHSNLIDAHIKNIRKKIDVENFIQSVRGVGYIVKK